MVEDLVLNTWHAYQHLTNLLTQPGILYPLIALEAIAWYALWQRLKGKRDQT